MELSQRRPTTRDFSYRMKYGPVVHVRYGDRAAEALQSFFFLLLTSRGEAGLNKFAILREGLRG